MTPKEINDLKKIHNRLLEDGQALYAQLLRHSEEMLSLQNKIAEAEGDEYDPIPLIFGAGFNLNQNEE